MCVFVYVCVCVFLCPSTVEASSVCNDSVDILEGRNSDLMLWA